MDISKPVLVIVYKTKIILNIGLFFQNHEFSVKDQSFSFYKYTYQVLDFATTFINIVIQYISHTTLTIINITFYLRV